ncbi:hypothetical protein [uncultured Winogradskyella sp.]|uniref:hypothetical protein n=1 Tax=uncultured Winogradskyella sp. TaxID=395353 RepID=UPI00261560A0|nr:hypothetical protein [uncultured Winogradskyella sp.]
MSENTFGKYLDNYASKTIITLFGLVAAFVTIYAYWQEKSVDLRYEIIANTNVLDFNADINKLEVLYDSTSLKKTGENLRIYTVKIVNNGQENIIKEFYDENEPVGIKITSGKIIEKPEIIQSSNDYLKRNVKFIKTENEGFLFSNVIIESGEFFTIKLLVLHKNSNIPQIKSYGKIAGQQKIDVVNAVDVKEEMTFLKKVYYGNVWTQLLRLISYFIIAILIIAVFALTSQKIDSTREKKRKKKNLSEFKNLKTYQYTRMDDAIFDRYLDNGGFELKRMSKLIENDKELNDTYKELSEQVKSKEYRRYRIGGEDWSVINEMLNDGVVFKENEELSINQAMKDTLEKFLNFLTDKGEFKRERKHYPYEFERRVIIDKNE